MKATSTPIKQPAPSVLLPRLLLGAASLVASYLAYTKFTQGSLVGCGSGSSCSEVLGSKWATLFGVPVSVPGLITYLFLIVMAKRICSEGESHSLLFKAARIALWMIPLAALWFTIVQAVILKAFCPYCCTAHFLATLGVTLLWRSQRAAAVAESRPSAWRWAAPALGAASVAAMAATQHFGPEPKTYATSEIKEATVTQTNGASEVSFYDGEYKFSLSEYPVTGKLDNPNVLTAITDYACPHCRHLHDDLMQVLADQPKDALSILWLPGMRNDDSSKIHEMMLSLWKTDRAAHAEMEHAIFEKLIEATPAAVKAEMIKKLGQVKYDSMMQTQGEWAHNQVFRAFKLFEKNGEANGKKVLPMLMVGKQVTTGAIVNPLIYHQIIQTQLGLKVPEKVQAEAIARAAQNKADATTPATAMALFDKKFELKLDEFPITGNTHAKNAIVVVSDLYNCPPCRKLHEFLPSIINDYQQKEVSILWLPGQIAEDSGEIYRMTLALWKQDAAAATAIDDELIHGGAVTSVTAKKKIVEKLGSEAAFDDMMKQNGPWAAAQIKRSTDFYREATKRANSNVLPMIVVGDQLIRGAVDLPVVYHRAVESQFGLQTKAALAAARSEGAPHAPTPKKDPSDQTDPKTTTAVATAAKGVDETRAPQPAPASTATFDIPGYSHKGKVLSYHSGYAVDRQSVPAIGDASSETADSEPLVMLMDYLSPSARAMAAEIIEAKRSVTLLPAMPSGDAQQAHRALLTLWKEQPDRWQTTVKQLLDAKSAPTKDSIIAEVTKAFGSEDKLTAAYTKHQAWLQDTLITTHRIYMANNRLLGTPRVPQLLIGAKLMTGDVPKKAIETASVAAPNAPPSITRTE